MLIFLARSARAWIVAPDLLPRAYERRRRRERHGGIAVAVAGERFVVTGMLVLDVRYRRRFLDRLHVRLRLHLNGEHDLDDILLDPVEHVGKELERFALVFLFGILLRIATQMN